jgi:hypothetical protein
MKPQKYGFVYIWKDRKRKMYYIGSHWGTECDGYVCSSNRMRDAYRRRPIDFTRRILEKTENREQLLIIENRWLEMAASKSKNKFYNLNFSTTNNLWWHNKESRLSVGQKISKKNKANPDFGMWSKGKTLSEEHKKKISESTSIAMKEYYKENPRTEEYRKRISENTKRLQREKKIGMHGKCHTDETKQKMRENNAMNNPIHIQKIRDVKRGIKYLKKDGTRKMALPNSEKWNALISEGYEVGY